MKEDGYVPDIKCVLHDVDEESREEALLFHSERLATAYGLMTSTARSPIRIIKNLRVCRDCHNALKIMSKIVGRLVIARNVKYSRGFTVLRMGFALVKISGRWETEKMATKNNNNQLALHPNHHQISSVNPSSVGCSPFFSYFTTSNAATASNNRSHEPQKSSLTSSESLKMIRHYEDQTIADHEAAMSPKLGCMGQIKKNKGSNRKIFQFRSTLSFPMIKGARVEDDSSQQQGIGMNDTMDLPLPVSKCNVAGDTKVDSLWKRRHGSGCKDLDSLDVVHLRHAFDGTGDLQA